MHSLPRDDSLTRFHAALVADLPERARILWIDGTGATDATLPSSPDRTLDRVVPPLTEADALASSSFGAVVVSQVDLSELAHTLDVTRRVLAPGGRLVVGTTGTVATPATLVARLAVAGFAVDQIRTIRANDDTPLPPGLALPADLAAGSDPSVDHVVVGARACDVATAEDLARRQLETAAQRTPGDHTLDVSIVDALVQRERQLAALDRSFGWRLLARYGPYKHRYVLPAWRVLQDGWRRLTGSAETDATAYERWSRFAAAFHAAPRGDRPHRSMTVSIVVAVSGATAAELAATIASVLAQDHKEWELRLAGRDECGLATIDAALSRAGAADRRIHVDRIAHASDVSAANAAASAARGEIVALLVSLVELAPDALSTAVDGFAETGADVLYGDEDSRAENGRPGAPELKPAWSPDWLLSWMYWPRVFFVRKSAFAAGALLQEDLTGAAYYDLALRLTELCARIVHVPRILSHAGGPPTPTGGPATPAGIDAGQRALEAALVRRGVPGVVHGCAGGVYRVQRRITGDGTVTVIVPTRDNLAMLRRCLATLETTDHRRFEIVIVDNGSTEARTLEFLATTRHVVRRAPGPFNFARLNNGAVSAATGEYVVFLNDDTEVRDPGWLRAMEEHAQRPEVGAVGARLLYPNGKVQHAGIVVGIGGLAGHPGRLRSRVPPGIRNVTAVTAACLMMRRRTFDTVGGFDERLPVNSNDVDLCLRLRDRGYLVVYTPYATLRHHESATRGLHATPDDAWLMTRRWRSVLRADPYYNPNADLVTESGAMDLSKPDGLVRLYEGPAGPSAMVRIEPGGTIGQGCYVAGADLTAIVLHVRADGDAARALRLTIREAPDAAAPLRTVDHSSAGRHEGERWFRFEPIPHSGGRRWYFTLESRRAEPFDVARARIVSDAMGPTFENGSPAYGTLIFELYARAPYRCMTSPP